MKTNIPPPKNKPINPTTGEWTREWYFYLLNQFNRMGGDTSDTTIPELENGVSQFYSQPLPDEVIEKELSFPSAEEQAINECFFRLGEEQHCQCDLLPAHQEQETGVFDSLSVGLANGKTQIGRSGHQTMVGDARPWRDELSDALNIRSTGTGVAVNNTESTVDFAATAQIANDYLFLNIQLNHDKDLSSSIYPHIHFFQGSNAAPNFLIQYRWQVGGGEKVTAWTSLVCNNLVHAYSGTTKHNKAYSAPISPPVGSSLSDVVQFRVCRDTDNDSGLFAGADPYSGAVGVLAFDIHFMINSIGSDTETTK